MIENYQKFVLEDQNKKNNLIIEVNWNPEDEDTNECKVLKLTYPDGKQAYIKKEYFNAFLFVIGSKEEQRKMIPQRIRSVREYQTILGIEAKKDISKGERINVLVTIPLPAIVEEIIAEVKKRDKKSKSGILVP